MIASPPSFYRASGIFHLVGLSKKSLPTIEIEEAYSSFAKNSGPGSRRRNQVELRALLGTAYRKLHGQRSFLATFFEFRAVDDSTPRFTFVSEGHPVRRLLIVSKNR